MQNFKTDNDLDVTVEYAYEDHGTCVSIWECWHEGDDLGDCAIDVKLTNKEHDRMCAWIMENRHWSDYVDRAEPD